MKGWRRALGSGLLLVLGAGGVRRAVAGARVRAVSDAYAAGVRPGQPSDSLALSAHLRDVQCDDSAGCWGAVPRPRDGFIGVRAVPFGDAVWVHSVDTGARERVRAHLGELLGGGGRPYCFYSPRGAEYRRPFWRWGGRVSGYTVELHHSPPDAHRPGDRGSLAIIVRDGGASVVPEYDRPGACPSDPGDRAG